MLVVFSLKTYAPWMGGRNSTKAEKWIGSDRMTERTGVPNQRFRFHDSMILCRLLDDQGDFCGWVSPGHGFKC